MTPAAHERVRAFSETESAMQRARMRWKAVQVDHVLSRKRGGADFDPANLQAFCHSLYSQKSLALDGGFGLALNPNYVPEVRGYDTSGRPVAQTIIGIGSDPFITNSYVC
jgi:hypothetical protein